MRTLLACMAAALLLPCGYHATGLALAPAPGEPDQGPAVAAIRELGGTMEFDEESPGHPVVKVSLNFKYGLRDRDLARLGPLLGRLPHLRVLYLEACPRVTPAGIAHLRGLTQLRELSLQLTPIKDEGLEHLRGMTGLTKLLLAGTQITDKGVALVGNFKGLRSLALDSNPGITDKGLACLDKLPHLTHLWLGYMKVGDRGLAHLKGLKRLEWLLLTGTPLTDAGMPFLKDLGELRVAYLNGTRITDAGLVHLRGLRKLDELYLTGTRVTPRGIAGLQAVLHADIR